MAFQPPIAPPPIPVRPKQAGERLRELSCPQCDHKANIPARFAGKRVRCPRCKAEFRLADDASRLIASVAPSKEPPGVQRSENEATENFLPTRFRHWMWLVPCCVVIASATVFGTWKLLGDNSGTDDETAELTGSNIGKSPATRSTETRPARKPDAGKLPKQNDPPKPADDGDRLVQINKLDEQKLVGLKVIKPADALQRKTSLDVNNRPLIEILKQLAIKHRFVIVIDQKALDDEGIPLKWPVTASVKHESLGDVLEAVLGPLQLKHVLPTPDSKAVVLTSELKAAGMDANTLLKKGTLIAGNLPRNTTPTTPRQRTTPRKKPKRKPARETPQTIYRRGKRLLAQRKLDEAIAEFNKALRQRRNFVDAQYNRGYAYLLKLKNKEAVTDFSAVISQRRNYAAAYASRAIAYTRMGYSQRARKDRVTAVKLRRRRK